MGDVVFHTSLYMLLRTIVLLILSAKLSAQAPRLVLPIGHTGPVTSTGFSPDGNKLLTVSSDGTAKLWETNSGKLLQDYKSGGDASSVSVTGATFSPDGNYVIINYEDHELCIWDANTGKRIWDWSGTPSDYEIPASQAFNHFSPDGNRIAMFSRYHEDTLTNSDAPTIYNCKTRRPVVKLKAQNAALLSLFFTPDGKNIIASCGDSSIRTWNANNGRLLKKFRFSTADIQLLQVSNDNRTLLFTEDSTTRIIDIITGKQSYPDKSHRKKDKDILYELSPDGTRLIALSGYILSSWNESQNGYSTVTVWDTRTWKQLFKVDGLSEQATSTFFNGVDQKITLITNDSAVKIIDATTGELVHKLTGFKGLVNTVRYNSITDKAIITLRDRLILVWDAATGKLNPALNRDTSKINANINTDATSVYDMNTNKTVFSVNELTGLYTLRFSYDLSYNVDKILAVYRDKAVTVWDVSTGKLINSFNSTSPVINDAAISDDGKFAAMACEDRTASVWDISNGNIVSEMRSHTNPVNDAWFSGDMKNLLLVTVTGKKMLNLENGKLITDTTWINKIFNTDSNLGEPFEKINLQSPDGNLSLNWGVDIVQLSPNNDAGEKMLRHAQRGLGPNNGRMDHVVRSVKFSPDSKLLVLTLEDNSTRIFDIEKDAFIDMIILIDSMDYVNLLSNGYYQSTTNAAKQLHYITNDSRVISFEQLDVKYNRPDKVLEETGGFNRPIIESYRNAYYKRLQKLGIDSTSFQEGYSLPVAELQTSESNNEVKKSDRLSLHITAKDSIYHLEKFNVWINEVPLFGMKGISFRKQAKHALDTTINVLLSQGDNRIETSVTNQNGIESYRKPLMVKYVPENMIPGKVYFIGIGINEFADSSHNLTWCVQDIRDLAIALQQKYGNRLQIVDTLYNERATWTNIRSLKKKLQQTAIDDKVIISFSGHGLLSKDYDYYLSSYTVNFNNPEEGGIPYDEIEQMLDEIPARKKIMLLDACHSGEVDKDELKKIQSSTTELAQNQTSISNTSRGVKLINTDSTARLGLQNSFELMQSLFVNVNKGTGAVVISASGGVQFAQERSELGHGVFTYSVIEAIHNYPTMKVSEFKRYVGDRVTELTHGLQKPTTRNETIAVDWNVW